MFLFELIGSVARGERDNTDLSGYLQNKFEHFSPNVNVIFDADTTGTSFNVRLENIAVKEEGASGV